MIYEVIDFLKLSLNAFNTITLDIALFNFFPQDFAEKNRQNDIKCRMNYKGEKMLPSMPGKSLHIVIKWKALLVHLLECCTFNSSSIYKPVIMRSKVIKSGLSIAFCNKPVTYSIFATIFIAVSLCLL